MLTSIYKDTYEDNLLYLNEETQSHMYQRMTGTVIPHASYTHCQSKMDRYHCINSSTHVAQDVADAS